MNKNYTINNFEIQFNEASCDIVEKALKETVNKVIQSKNIQARCIEVRTKDNVNEGKLNLTFRIKTSKWLTLEIKRSVLCVFNYRDAMELLSTFSIDILELVNNSRLMPIEWLDIEKDNLPEREVLAANFSKKSYGYGEKLVGRLYINEVFDYVTCEAEDTVLENCTHYVDIHKFDID